MSRSDDHRGEIDVELELQRAFAELDSKIPNGYFETFSSKVAASLETETSMQSTPPDVETPETHPTPPPAAERDEHSGLHEIKALAETAQNRIRRRRTSESDVEEAMLSSSSAALAAVVLPEPDAETRPPEPIAPEPLPASAPRGSVPTWLWAVGGTAVVAAAAAAALFFFSRSGSSEEAGDTVAVADQAPPAPAAPAETAPAPAPEPSINALDEGSEEPEPADDLAVAEPEPEPQADDAEADTSRRAVGGSPARARAERRERARQRSAKRKERKTKVKKPDPDEAVKTRGASTEADTVAEKRDIDDLLDEVAGDSKKPKKTAEPEEKKVDKKRLDSGDVRSAMRSVSGAVKSCQKKTGFNGRVKVRFSVSPSGRIGSVKASGASGAVHSCVASAVKRARFPTFQPPSMSFRYSFLLAD